MVPPCAAAELTNTTPSRALEGGWNTVQLSSTADMDDLVEMVTGAMAALAYTQRDTRGMRLSLSEALMNARQHGHHLDPLKVISVRYSVGRDQTIVEVTDEGTGFDAQTVPDPTTDDRCGQSRGRGVYLMRAYMTSVQFNERGNTVTLCKTPSTADGR